MKYLLIVLICLSAPIFAQEDFQEEIEEVLEPQTEEVYTDQDGGDEGSLPDQYDQEPQE